MHILSQLLTMRMLTGHHPPLDVDVVFKYRTWDPFAVELEIQLLQHTAAVRVFDRGLLADGLHTAAGEGDVHVEPTRKATTLIVLGAAQEGRVLLEAATGDLDDFLARSFAAVRKGEEAGRIDWAACIASLLNG